jgi:hypothetical protein
MALADSPSRRLYPMSRAIGMIPICSGQLMLLVLFGVSFPP